MWAVESRTNNWKGWGRETKVSSWRGVKKISRVKAILKWTYEAERRNHQKRTVKEWTDIRVWNQDIRA